MTVAAVARNMTVQGLVGALANFSEPTLDFRPAQFARVLFFNDLNNDFRFGFGRWRSKHAL